MTDTRFPSESFFKVWGRRAISIPLYMILWLIAVSSLPLLLIMAFIIDAARGNKWAISRSVIFFAFYLCCEVAGIAASFFLWIAKWFYPGSEGERFLRWNYGLQRWWADALSRGTRRIFGIRIEVEGSDELDRGPVIIFIRHASAADTLLPAVFIANPHGIRLRYVLKHQLLWGPCLDIVGNRLPNCFVRREAEEGHLVQRLMEDLGPDDGVIIYPEGTRFTLAKRERILNHLAQTGNNNIYEKAGSLKNVLPPRLGGPLHLARLYRSCDLGHRVPV